MVIFLFFLALPAVKSDFEIEIRPDSDGEDTRPIEGVYNMLWVWAAFSLIFFSGALISIVRDVVPRQPIPESSQRYISGENRNICKFMLEEYLLTGWIFAKPEKKFSNTARWSLIFLIIYLEMLIVGVCYHLDTRDKDEFDSFGTWDLVYSTIAVFITFCFYLVAYGLFLNVEQDLNNFHTYRHYFGYLLFASVIISCSLFVFVFTYQLKDEHESQYEDLVTQWVTGFALALCFECLFSENIRLAARSFIIWRDKYSEDPEPQEVQLSTQERVHGPQREKFVSFGNY